MSVLIVSSVVCVVFDQLTGSERLDGDRWLVLTCAGMQLDMSDNNNNNNNNNNSNNDNNE